LLVAGLMWEKSTAGWWLISQANRAGPLESKCTCRWFKTAGDVTCTGTGCLPLEATGPPAAVRGGAVPPCVAARCVSTEHDGGLVGDEMRVRLAKGCGREATYTWSWCARTTPAAQDEWIRSRSPCLADVDEPDMVRSWTYNLIITSKANKLHGSSDLHPHDTWAYVFFWNA
jgi:hypothetical protein